MAKNNRKRHWRSNQSQETYFIESKKQKFRSRSTFKLIEINKKFKIFRPYSSILDLGASPGGWSEYSVSKLNNKGKVIATGDRIFGGIMNTASGLTFATGNPDGSIYAFNSDGIKIWEDSMPFAGSAPPMSYSYKNCHYIFEPKDIKTSLENQVPNV